MQYHSYILSHSVKDASIENAIHCLAVMLYYNWDRPEDNPTMKRLTPVAMRVEVKEGINNCLIINDSYNRYQFTHHSPRLSKSKAADKVCAARYTIGHFTRRAAAAENGRYLALHKGITPHQDRPVISDNALHQSRKRILSDNRGFSLHNLARPTFRNELILIKGAREFHFELISETLELKQNETILEINLDAIVHNYNLFKSKLRPETKIICMVKAFGYRSQFL